jgi:hypothetical protein
VIEVPQRLVERVRYNTFMFKSIGKIEIEKAFHLGILLYHSSTGSWLDGAAT